MQFRKDLDVGQIHTTITITNRADQVLANRKVIAPDEVRSIEVNVLIDTGATTLCLPAEVISQLGLDLLKEVIVETAAGLSAARVYQDAKISILDREGTFECLELPGGRDPLLGVIPLEALGIELDLQTRALKTLPVGPDRSYMTIY